MPVIAIDDLIVAKVLAGRPKDIEDARGLWHAHGPQLDEGRIRRLLLLLQEALSQSDLLPVFDDIVRAAADRRR